MTERRMAHGSRRGPRLALSMVGLLLMLTGTRAHAQDPPVLDTVQTTVCKLVCDVVGGVVFDSLANEPLEGALVVARPSGTTVTTDSLGRFLITSDGMVEQITVFHEALDRMALGALVAARPAGAATWRNVRITTPSLLTLWPRLCDNRRPLAMRSVIITGTARLADNRTRVAGAKVIVQWPRPTHAVGGDELRSAETFTDSLGNYLVCGVEDFVEPSLLALSHEAQSGVVSIPADMRPLRRVDLVLGRVGADGVPVNGRIVGNDGKPLADMRVSVDGREEEIVTGADGTFLFPQVPLGSRMLGVRAVGYPPVAQMIDVLEEGNAPLTIPMEKTFAIEGVTVTATAEIRRDRAEFEMRKRAGWGRFIDSSAFARAPIIRTALQMTPGINVNAPPPGSNEPATDFVITGRRGCRAIVWVDGVLDLDNLANRLNKDDLAAVEIYPSSALAPARYIRVMADDCPVVLFWTRHGLRP